MELIQKLKYRSRGLFGSWQMNRFDRQVLNTLGRIKMPLPQGADKLFRNPTLEVFDAYYDGRQYDHLSPWDCNENFNGGHIKLRDRRPRIQYAFTKLLTKRLASRLVGEQVFPTLKVDDDPDTTEYIRYILKASQLKARILEPIRRELAAGSVLVRFFFVPGAIQVEHYVAKYCYPEFDPAGNLTSVRVQYAYVDKEDKDENGKPRMKWYRLDLGTQTDVIYDNPVIENLDDEPVFSVVENIEHGLGFVQAEWFRTAEFRDSPDGYSLIDDGVTDFIDELNYSLSQSSQASSYNQDPQLIFKGIDEESISSLIRSSTKAWNIGARENADARFLESDLSGVKVAIDLRDKMRLGLQDITRIIMLDPEKMVASAQSGKAMEILHGPMVELVGELRPMVAQSLKGLVAKMCVVNLVQAARGIAPAVTIPPGYQPQSLEITVDWPPVFPMTIQDLQQKIGAASSAAGASLISRETGTRWIAKDFNVEDVEGEIAKIAAQPILSPFGQF